MKKIILSFDDARLDTYTVAWPVLKKCGLICTINVTTDFVLHPERWTEFASGGNMAMTPSMLIECQQEGVEIACHGHTHQNTVNDILENIDALQKMGIDTKKIGFASPNSGLTRKNSADVMKLVDEEVLSYVRTGIQVRREGIWYTGWSWIATMTHSPGLFYWLNKRNILTDPSEKFLSSVAVTRSTTISQLTNLIEKMQDNQSVIIMFHSIQSDGDIGYQKDKWYWETEQFSAFARYLQNCTDVTVCTTKSLVLNGNQ